MSKKEHFFIDEQVNLQGAHALMRIQRRKTRQEGPSLRDRTRFL